MASLQELIAGYLSSGNQTSADKYLAANPDVAAAAQTFLNGGLVPGTNAQGEPVANNGNSSYKGVTTPQEFALKHYQLAGSTEGRALPAGDNTQQYKLGQTLSQILAQGKQTLASRGLSYDQYGNLIESGISDVLQYVPKDDPNPGMYFNANLVDNLLNAEQQKQRSQYRQQVNTKIPGAIDRSVFGTAIDDILGKQQNTAQEFLDRGLKRGQFNGAGYAAGASSLANQRAKALADLNTKHSDLLSKYNTQLGGIKDRATQAASGYQLGDSFNIDDYLKEAESFQADAAQRASGDLLSLIGDTNYFDTSKIRLDAGMGQGSQNLRNLDVLDALNKKKQAGSVGHGLGSQGAF